MKTLHISFWHVTLENFPIGTFIHRVLSSSEAKQLIDSTRAHGKVVGVSRDDLLSPNSKDRLENHNELREVLETAYGVSLRAEDFLQEDSDEGGETLISALPLSLFEISSDESLMVINCSYEMTGRSPKMIFKVSPETIEFHLFEAVEDLGTSSGTEC